MLLKRRQDIENRLKTFEELEDIKVDIYLRQEKKIVTELEQTKPNNENDTGLVWNSTNW